MTIYFTNSLKEEGAIFPLSWVTRSKAIYYESKSQILFEKTNGNILKNAHLYIPWISQMVLESNLVSIVRQVLGNHVGIENTYLLSKPPNSSYTVPMHQDGINTRLQLPLRKSLSAWLAISEATIENGCLKVWQKSHLDGYQDFQISNQGFNSLGQGKAITALNTPNENDGIYVPLKQGEMCLFSPALFHESGSNKTSKARIGLNIRFIAGDAFDIPPKGVPPLLMIVGEESKIPKAQVPFWSDEEGLYRYRANIGVE